MSHLDKFSRTMIRPAPAPAQLRDDELDLFSIFRLIRRRIWLIVIVSAVLTALALPLILSMERPYYGQSRLLIQQPLTSTLGVEPAPVEPPDTNTEVERLLSRDIAVRVVQEFQLDRLEEFNPTLKPESALRTWIDTARRWLKGEPEPPPPTPEDIMESVLENYHDAVTVRRSGMTAVVDIGFSSLDPYLAADVPNALVRIYLDAREQGVRGRVGRPEAWLEPQIEAQSARLARALAAVRTYRGSSGLVSDDARADAARTISTLSARQAELATEGADLEATLASLREKRGSPDAAQSIDTDTMGLLRRALQQQQSALDRLLETFGENYGPVLDARSAVREADAAIAAEVDRTIQSLQTRMASIRREDAATAAGLSEAGETLSRLNELQNTLTTLVLNAEGERQALELLEDQRRELVRQGEVPATEIEVLSPATVPLDPTGRGRLMYLAAAMVAAGSVALTVALISEMLDSGLRSPQQLERLPGVMSGGLVPVLSKAEAGNLRETLHGRRASMFSEAVRGLLHALEQTNEGVLPTSILVTSPLPGEGKSTLAAAIAIELAASGRKVLLVDGDLRQGRLHTMLGVEEGPGLLDLLSGRAGVGDVVRHDFASRIDYVTRGSAGEFAALRDPAQLADLARLAAAAGAVVVFDSAPVLATTETVILAGLTQRTLLVMRWGKTHRQAVDLAVAQIKAQSSAPILAAMNVVDLKRHARYGFRDAGMFVDRLAKYYPERT